MSRFFCLCIDDFPAWAEAYLNPALREQPVLIRCGGVVIAASDSARYAGVQAGCSLARVQALLPDVTSLPHNEATTDLVRAEVFATFYGQTPVLEPLHQNIQRSTATLRTQVAQRPGKLLASLHRPADVQPLLREWTAYGCAVRGGIADDRTTAELSALMAAPGTLQAIEPGRSRNFLREVPIGVLAQIGISRESIERLGWFGWATVHDLRKLTQRQLNDQFPEGETLFRYAAANDLRPLATYSPPLELHAALQFEIPAQQPTEWEPALEHLLCGLSMQLEGRTTRAITIGVEDARGWRQQRQLLRAPLNSLCSLRRAALKVLDTLLAAESSVALTGLAVRFGRLAQPQAVQTALFDEQRKLDIEILRSLEARFPRSIKRAVVTNPSSYLPEDAFLYEPIQLVPMQFDRDDQAGSTGISHLSQRMNHKNHALTLHRPKPATQRSATRRRVTEQLALLS